jgi:gamma-glutamyltranspeptidase/glutathione hydrolase
MAIKTKSKQVVFTIFSLGIVFYSQVALASITSPLGSKKGMVVSAHPLASDAGITMLRKGGFCS